MASWLHTTGKYWELGLKIRRFNLKWIGAESAEDLYILAEDVKYALENA